MQLRSRIEEIEIDANSRDDIPAILLGLQSLYLDDASREAVFQLLQDRFGKDRRLTVGRPGMELWTILVLAVLKRGARQEELEELDRYIAHTKRQIDQTGRRILQEGEIPQEEKVFSVFEEHTL